MRGAAIHGANGIMFDDHDQLHIASVAGREILVMEPNTGKLIARLGPELGVEGPDDLAFGPDGSLYWTSILTGVVGRLTPDGVFSSQFVAPGVNPITFSDDGRLFVALDFLGDGLYELDPALVNPPRPIVVASAENPMPLGFLNGMDWGPDGGGNDTVIIRGHAHITGVIDGNLGSDTLHGQGGHDTLIGDVGQVLRAAWSNPNGATGPHCN